MPAGKTLEQSYRPTYTLLQEAIKKVGVGRRGSTRLSRAELDRLKNKTMLKNCSAISKGAFLAALLNQGLERGEEELLIFITRSDNNNNTPNLRQVAPILAKLFPSYPAKYVLDWLLYEDASYAVCFTEWKLPSSFALDDAAASFDRWVRPKNKLNHSNDNEELQLLKALYTVLTSVHLLSEKQTLTEKEAYVLGQFLLLEVPEAISSRSSSLLATSSEITAVAPLFYSQGSEFIRGFCMSMLRVRYETDAEWNGLYKALAKTVHPLIKEGRPSQKRLQKKVSLHHPTLILAEPMNGYTKHAFITPLVAWWSAEYLQMKAVHLTGSNPGPKFGFTFKDVATELNLPVLCEEALTGSGIKNCGAMADQAVFVPAMHAWVERRREIVKRPAWATLEKFIDPINPIILPDEKLRRAEVMNLKRVILVTSAFHGPYFEKMCLLARTAGYAGYIIVQWGAEGGLGATLSRPLKLRAGVNNNNNNSTKEAYLEQNFTISYKDIAYPRIREAYARINLHHNAKFIKDWLDRFDAQFSNEGLSLPSKGAILYKYGCGSDLLYAGIKDSTERNFAACVRISLLGYTAALLWIEHQWAQNL